MIQKTVQDYYEILQKEYPNIPLSDIKRICQYGWKSFYLHNSYGCDVLIKRYDFWAYCGSFYKNPIYYFDYYKKKLCTKLRILYKRYKTKWNGYYYFALTEKQYQEYLNQKNKKGRPRKKFKFKKIFLYKIFDECNIFNHNRVAIFKVPYPLDMGFKYYKEELISEESELVLERPFLKFKDILPSNYKYQLLDQSKYKKMIKDGISF